MIAYPPALLEAISKGAVMSETCEVRFVGGTLCGKSQPCSDHGAPPDPDGPKVVAADDFSSIRARQIELFGKPAEQKE